MKKNIEKQEVTTIRELDAGAIDGVQGGFIGALLKEFAGEIAYGAGYVFGGAAEEYGKHPPAYDNGKI